MPPPLPAAFDVATDPRKPRLHKVVEPEEIQVKQQKLEPVLGPQGGLNRTPAAAGRLPAAAPPLDASPQRSRSHVAACPCAVQSKTGLAYLHSAHCLASGEVCQLPSR